MSILNITNITNNPEDWIKRKFNNAREELKDEQVEISDENFTNFVEAEIDNLVNYMEESKGSQLLLIIDNYLINSDFYKILKDFIESLED